MPIVSHTPRLRFEYDYSGKTTVLDGAELDILIRQFILHNSQELKKHANVMDSFLLSICFAYQSLYGRDVVVQGELRDLFTPDARKLDLFYKGMFILLCQALYPDEDWEKKLRKKVTFLEVLNEVITLKPNFFGIGIDLNAIFKRFLSRKS